MHFAHALVALSLAAFAGIIGPDNRHSWHEEKSPVLRELGRATAIFVHGKDIDGDTLAKSVLTHGEYDNLCPDQRYRDELAPGFCSGFLVGPDSLATASHCLPKGCDDTRFVFDFYNHGDGAPGRQLARDSVYTCRETIARDAEADWVLVKLDRPTTGRTFFRARREGRPAVGAPLAMLGFPRGIPLKIADGATVQPLHIADEDHYFEADLDSFGGNSGSAVVDTRTGTLEGILTVAFGEFETEKAGEGCKRLRHIDDPTEATPAWVTRATLFAKLLR